MKAESFQRGEEESAEDAECNSIKEEAVISSNQLRVLRALLCSPR
jgi:hypothetical protein